MQKNLKTNNSTFMSLRGSGKVVSLFFGTLLLTVLVGMPNTASAKSTNTISPVPNVLLAYAGSGFSRYTGNPKPRGSSNVPITNSAPKVIKKSIPKVAPNTSSAKSASWSSVPINLGYTTQYSPSTWTGLSTYCDSFSSNTCQNKWHPFANIFSSIYTPITATINRKAFAQKNGITISDGATVRVGDTISFTSAPPTNTDISWFSGNFSYTGYWLANASKKPTNTPGIYTLLSVNPSKKITYSHTGSTAGLSCNTSGSSCTVTSSNTTNGAINGTIKTQVNYSATYGKFYYYNRGGAINFYNSVGKGSYNGVAMRACTPFSVLFTSTISNGWGAFGGPSSSPLSYSAFNVTFCNVPSTDYKLTVPAQQISFSFKAVPKVSLAPNQNLPQNLPLKLPPPTITGPASANFGSTQTYTFTAINPNKKLIRYNIYWGGKTTLGQTTGFVTAGASAQITLPTTGTSYTIYVRTENKVGGKLSAWSFPYDVILTQPAAACGLAATSNKSLFPAPTTGLCTNGGTASPVSVSASGRWTWTCS